MDTSPTTRKVVFSFLAMLLTLIGLLALSQPANALTGFMARSPYGFATVAVQTKPSNFAARAYSLPNGASINISCITTNAYGNSWLKLTDNNYLAQNNSSVPVDSKVIPVCGQTKFYADRTLLQASGPGVYIVQSNKILAVPNAETLTTCLGGWAKVVKVSDAELSVALQTYPNGGVASCPISFPNGTTLLAPSSGTVYVISNSQLYGIPNPETLIGCLGGWAGVKNISNAQMAWVYASYSYAGAYNCPPVAYAENTLLQASGPGVYLVHGGKYFGIPDPGVLNCYGGWAAVRHVTDYEITRLLSTYPSGGTAGCPYSVPNGTKLLAPSGTVFIISWGKSYGMPSADTLIRCYGGWSGVRPAPQAEIDLMLATYPYAGTAGCAPPPATPSREQKAIDWAKSQIGSTYWNGMCELMDEQAYGTSGRFASALTHANYESAIGQMHAGDGNVPAGALAYFGAATVNGGYGHVMISIGGGQFVTNGYTYNGHVYGAFITTLGGISAGPYIGWAYADSSWPGR
jgi:hypothetical protein